MKKILIVNSYYAPTIVGGAEVSTQLLAEGLTKHYQVYVLTTGSQKSGIQKEEKNGVKIYRIPCMNLYWPAEQRDRSNLMKLGWHFINTFNIKQYKLLKKLLVEIRPDIMHTQNLNGVGTYIWGIAKKLGIITVHTTRDYALFEPVKIQFINKILLHFNKRRSKYVDYVVGISEFILNKHKEKNIFPYSKESVVHNIVNAMRCERKPRKVGSPLIIGYFGQLSEKKGVHLLTQAIGLLSKDIVSKLVICGTGELEAKLRKQTEQDERIIFRGRLSLTEVNEQMANVDLTIVPSLWDEPFGRVIIESYNQGTPVLAFHVGGIPEVIYDKGWLLASQKANSIAEKIQSIQKQTESDFMNDINDCYYASEQYKDNINQYLEIYSSGSKL
ncbi:glycosyltransferase family 4 protein [Bacillus cereus]